MKKIVFVMSFFIILYTPFLVGAEGLENVIEETEEIHVPGFSVSDTARGILDGEISLSFTGVLEMISKIFFQKFRTNGSVIMKMAAVGMMSGVAMALMNGKNEALTLSCGAIAALLGLKAFMFSVDTALYSIDELFIFIGALMPSVMACMSATGIAQTAVVGSVFYAMQIFIYICKELAIPLISVITALGVSEKISGGIYLSGITNLLKSAFKWGTGLALTLYGIVLSIQSQGAGMFDTAAGKTVKYAVGSFVPVVGGALSDSLEVVLVSAKTIKNALGLSGIIGVLYIALSPLITIAVTAFMYKLVSCVFSFTAENMVTKIIGDIGENLVRVCGVVLLVSVMFIISLGALCCFGGGAF